MSTVKTIKPVITFIAYLAFAWVIVHFGLSLIKKPAEVSFIIPMHNQYRLGEIFPIPIELQGIDTPINVIQADLGFDPNILQAKAVTTGGSFAQIFLTKEIDNDAGYVRIAGGLPNPGIIPINKSHFATVYFTSKKPGLATVTYLPTSLVLGNDGKGSNVLRDYGAINSIILPESISPSELQQQQDLLIQEETKDQEVKTQLTFYNPQFVSSLNLKGQILGRNITSTPTQIWQSIINILHPLK